MAIIWSQNIEGNHYEVRSAGATLRLYRNGVNHSQWNPNRPLSGCIWDLISLPALYRPKSSIHSVLMLGFGAGTIARQLRELVAPERIVGLDIDPIHLSIADGFFECSEGCELIAADAVEWVRDTDSDEKFDLIIDDLYSEEDSIPVRCAPLDRAWFDALVERLSPNGMIVLNLVEPQKIPFLPPLVESDLKKRFPHAMQFSMKGYENRIIAFSESKLTDDLVSEQIRNLCCRYPACYGVGKRYIVEALTESTSFS